MRCSVRSRSWAALTVRSAQRPTYPRAGADIFEVGAVEGWVAH